MGGLRGLRLPKRQQFHLHARVPVLCVCLNTCLAVIRVLFFLTQNFKKMGQRRVISGLLGKLAASGYLAGPQVRRAAAGQARPNAGSLGLPAPLGPSSLSDAN